MGIMSLLNKEDGARKRELDGIRSMKESAMRGTRNISRELEDEFNVCV
jgi:hypothetical protein